MLLQLGHCFFRRVLFLHDAFYKLLLFAQIDQRLLSLWLIVDDRLASLLHYRLLFFILDFWRFNGVRSWYGDEEMLTVEVGRVFVRKVNVTDVIYH